MIFLRFFSQSVKLHVAKQTPRPWLDFDALHVNGMYTCSLDGRNLSTPNMTVICSGISKIVTSIFRALMVNIQLRAPLALLYTNTCQHYMRCFTKSTLLFNMRDISFRPDVVYKRSSLSSK